MTEKEALDLLYHIPGEHDWASAWETSGLLRGHTKDNELMRAGRQLGHIQSGTTFMGGVGNTPRKVTKQFLRVLDAGHRDLIIKAGEFKNQLDS